MQCLGSKQKKIPLIELRSVVLPAYANTICTTNEGVKYGDYNRVLSNRKARELFKHTPNATRIIPTIVNIINEQPNLQFPYIYNMDLINCYIYLPGIAPSNLLNINNFYVTLISTDNPNLFIMSYDILYSILLKLNVEITHYIIDQVKRGNFLIIYSSVSCCTIIYLKPLTIVSFQYNLNEPV